MDRIRYHASSILAWGIASLEACLAGSLEIQPLHLLVALLKILDGTHHRDAERLGFRAESLFEFESLTSQARELIRLSPAQLTHARRLLRQTYLRSAQSTPPQLLHRSMATKAIFRQAASLAILEGSASYTILHLLEAALDHLPAEARPIFGEAQRLRQRQGHHLDTAIAGGRQELPAIPRDGIPSQSPALDALGRDLTHLARSGRLAPIVGRHDEILKLARHLLRVSKRNVLVVGEAGVGKTAVVEGLALHASSEGAPEELSSMRIVELGIAALVAGTRYRGDLEERLQIVLKEAQRDPNLILFLDEIHLAVGTGAGGDAPLDIANIFKPALARGEIRCIGATTEAEFDRYIKNDTAFMRRFQLLRIHEPLEDEALEICRAWARRIEQYQGVTIDEDAITASLELSVRHIRDRFLPDKAIDLLDNAAALVKLSTLSFRNPVPTKNPPIVGRVSIEAALEEQTGITLRASEVFDLIAVEFTLRSEIIGQNQAIDELISALDAIRTRDETARGPIGAVMLLGPTGTGKTMAAELVGKVLSANNAYAFSRFNMNEYKQRHELARLSGAPPGFIGHEEGGALFRLAQANPKGVILLDEMEKAHPEIADFFLQIFDMGETRDSRGRPVDFRGQIFFLTCNLVPNGTSRRAIGFAGAQEEIGMHGARAELDLLQEHFGPEFLARMTRIVSFREFELQHYEELLERQIEVLRDRILGDFSVDLHLSTEAKRNLLHACSAQREGARGFLRRFERMLVVPVLAFAGEKATAGCLISVEWEDAAPIISCAP